MTLRTKTLLIIALTLSLLVLILHIVFSQLLIRDYLKLEADGLKKDIGRAQKALLERIDQLTIKASDWAKWDDTYNFLQDKNQDYIDSNLTASALESLGLNNILYYDNNKNFVYGTGVDYQTESLTQPQESLLQFLNSQSWILTHENEKSLHQGIITLPEGLLIFTSQPVLTSEHKGPIRGSLIFTKIINSELIERLALQTELSLSAYFLNSTDQPEEVRLIVPQINGDTPITQKTINDKMILGYVLLKDITNSPALLLRVEDHRSILQQGRNTRSSAITSLILAGLGITILIFILLEYSVISRLKQLNTDVIQISSSGDSSQRVTIHGNDELMQLGNEINKMLATLNSTEGVLRNAKEAALAANKAKSHFVANVSHEIRTPINGILGMTEVLRNLESIPEKKEYLGIIKQSSETLLYIINEILDFSKIEAGKLSLEEIPFRFKELVRNTVRSISLKAFEKGVDIVFDIDNNIPDTIIGDPIRLRQIFTNLISNAIKFTESGEVIFTARLISIKEEEIYLEFKTKDTGIGIAEDKLSKLFNPFTQADSSTTRKYGGTGLGLSITKQLIDLMQGTITVQSNPGEGTTFTCTAKLNILPNSILRDSLNEIVQNTPIIIVSDNSFFKQTLNQRLLEFGIKRINSLADIRDLIKIIDQTCTNIIIIDRNPLQPFSPVLLKENNSKYLILLPPDKLAESESLKSQTAATILIKPSLPEEILAAIYSILGCDGSLPEFLSPFSNTSSISTTSVDLTVTPLKILVADDAQINQKVLKLQLEQMGHSVELANNGVEVLSLLEKSEYFSAEKQSSMIPFDLILMDGDMPEIDGIQATKIIREREKLNIRKTHLPIIAVTAHAATTDRQNFLSVGMDDYITKPIDYWQLMRTINSIKKTSQINISTTAEQNLVTIEKLENFSKALSIKLRSQNKFNEHLVLELTGIDIINISDLSQRFNGNLSLVMEMVEIFFAEHEKLLEDLNLAIDQQDLLAIKRSAHAMKGSLLNVSASGGAMVAHLLEKLNNKDSLESINNLKLLLVQEIKNIKTIFEAFQNFDTSENFVLTDSADQLSS